MSDKTRIKVAAIVTALFMAGLSTVGVALHKHAPATAGTTAPAATVQQPAPTVAGQLSRYAEPGDDHNAAYAEREAE